MHDSSIHHLGVHAAYDVYHRETLKRDPVAAVLAGFRVSHSITPSKTEDRIEKVSTKKTILFVITKSDLGGAQRVVQDLINALIDQSINNVVLIAGESGPLTENAAKAGAQVIIEPGLQRNVAFFSDLAAVFKLRQWFKEVDPAIVHIHSSKAGLIARLAAVGMKCKVIFTAHGWVFKRSSSGVSFRLLVWMERFLGKLTDYLIVVSQDDARLAQEHRIQPRFDTAMILNGAADIALDRKQLNNDPAILRVIMVARFSEPKDQILLARAVVGLDRKAELILVGDGPQFEDVSKQIQEIESDNSVQCIGASENVNSLLAASDVGALISNWEGLPIAIIEYMRSELAVIASDVGGVSELIEHEITGLLVPSGQLAPIQDALRDLFDDREKLKRLGQNARQKFLKQFLLERMLEEHFEIYKRASDC